MIQVISTSFQNHEERELLPKSYLWVARGIFQKCIFKIFEFIYLLPSSYVHVRVCYSYYVHTNSLYLNYYYMLCSYITTTTYTYYMLNYNTDQMTQEYSLIQAVKLFIRHCIEHIRVSTCLLFLLQSPWNATHYQARLFYNIVHWWLK